MRLHWHRRDLRLEDNPALVADERPGVGCGIHDPRIADSAGATRRRFYRGTVDAVAADYRDHGGRLLRVEGDPLEILPDLATSLDVAAVSWEADYTGMARRRDAAVSDRLAAEGIDIVDVDGAVLHPPGSITTTEGEAYQVFSYYWKKWRDRPKPPPAKEPADLVDPDAVARIDRANPADDGDTFGELPLEPGPEAATARLESFCDGPIFAYEARRDRPAADATSRLSAHLSLGSIGARTVWRRTERALDEAIDADGRESVEEFRRQLAWRELYTQALWDRPETVTENRRSFAHPIEWRDDPEGLEAWKAGETGFPIVDAGMRQLAAEAWMHNRARMIVASFLTKDLLIDWREGYRWFRERLLDHDTANDVGGWQWAASTSADAQPYFRIFNPMTQGKRHDPDATYIKRYVDELESVPAEAIHRWDQLDGDERAEHAPGYPAPIVDHDERRELALATYERAMGKAH